MKVKRPTFSKEQREHLKQMREAFRVKYPTFPNLAGMNQAQREAINDEYRVLWTDIMYPMKEGMVRK